MARGQKVVAALAFFIQGLKAVCAEDLFPTYRDEDWEEEARNGVVSLTSTAGNYSVNLSGFLILGMTMSAAVTMWAYLQTALARTRNHHTPYNYGYNQASQQGYHQPEYNHGYDQGYDNEVYKKEAPQGSNQKQRRSLYEEQEISLPNMMAKINRHFEEAEIRELGCRQRVICEASYGKGLSPVTFGTAIYKFFNYVENDDVLKTQVEEDKWAKPYFSAWNQGKKGVKSCKALYAECSLTPESVNNVLNHSD